MGITMKENQILKLIKEKLDYYYLKADYSHPTVGHVFITEGLHIIVNDDKEQCKWVEINSFDKEPKIRKVCKDEKTLAKELDKTLLEFYKIKHERINEENKSKPVRSSFINKQLYRLYLFAFDSWGKRLKKGKHQNQVYEMVFHPNGNLCASWVDSERILDRYVK